MTRLQGVLSTSNTQRRAWFQLCSSRCPSLSALRGARSLGLARADEVIACKFERCLMRRVVWGDISGVQAATSEFFTRNRKAQGEVVALLGGHFLFCNFKRRKLDGLGYHE